MTFINFVFYKLITSNKVGGTKYEKKCMFVRDLYIVKKISSFHQSLIAVIV